MTTSKKILLVITTVVISLFIILACEINGTNTGELFAPRNFIIEWGRLSWTSDRRAEVSMVSIKRATSNEFEEVRFVAARDHGCCCTFTDGISLRELNLEIGKNIVKVISFGDSFWHDGVTTYGIRSKEATYNIIIDNIIQEQETLLKDPWIEIWGNQIVTNGRVIVYIKHPGENEFIRINGYDDHDIFFGELPDLRYGESTLKIIRRGTWAWLDGKTLVIASDSEPVFVPLINTFETRQIPAPTDLHISGSGTSATLSWNCSNINCGRGCSVSTDVPGDFNNVQSGAFNNSIQLNRLHFVLGDNEIMVTTHGRTIIENNNVITYEPGKTVMTFTVHQERQLLAPSNFRIAMIHGFLSLAWDSDPITNGNSLSDNFTLVEVKNPGQEEFRDAGFGGVISSIPFDRWRTWLTVGENIVRVRIATGNLSIINGVVTRYTPSDGGYVVLVKDASGNITIK